MNTAFRHTVGAKLSLAFAAVVLITAIVGGLSLVQLSRVSNASTELAKIWLPQIEDSMQLVQGATSYRTSEFQLLGTPAAEWDALLKSMSDDLQAIGREAASFAAQTASPEAKAIFDRVIGMTALAIVLGAGLAMTITRRITRPLSDAVKLAQAVASGDLTQDLRVHGQDELAQLQQALRDMVARLRALVGEVRDGVSSVSTAAAQIASGNHDLSSRTEQTAANLEETASSIEQLTSTVGQSADTARQANQLASSAASAAQRGGQVVDGVVERMQEISNASRKIADIIGVIDGIAFQTNILALNAAVEAARAGEQGRGFAVVASEVRSLAHRSAEAAREIKTLISHSVETVEAGSQDVGQAGQVMTEIVDGVRRVTDLMAEIAASAKEQHDGIGQVNQAVSHLDQMTQQNAALVEESTAASTSLREQAHRLAEAMAVFRVRANA